MIFVGLLFDTDYKGLPEVVEIKKPSVDFADRVYCATCYLKIHFLFSVLGFILILQTLAVSAEPYLVLSLL